MAESMRTARIAVPRPRQRLHLLERGGIIALVPEVTLKSLKGVLKGMSKTDLREKKAG